MITPKIKKTNLNYLFKNLGGYSMDSKTREQDFT